MVFYNHGSKWKSGLPGTDHGVFYGCIYDAGIRLGCFRHGNLFSQVKFDRFGVFHFPPGPHVFSASYGKHPAKRSQLHLILDSGQNYYLRAQSESRGIVEIEFETGRLDPMTCAAAVKETERAKPLTEDYFSPEGRSALVTVQAIPPCQ